MTKVCANCDIDLPTEKEDTPQFCSPECADEYCTECENIGFVEYLISVDDTKKMPCEKCHRGEPDEDAEYERHRDNQIEAEMQRQEARD